MFGYSLSQRLYSYLGILWIRGCMVMFGYSLHQMLNSYVQVFIESEVV